MSDEKKTTKASPMAVSGKEIKKRYPIPVYNYVVEVNGVAGSFTKVSGLKTQNTVITHKTSSLNGRGPVTMHMPAQPAVLDITLSRGLVQDTASEFFDWIFSTKLNEIDKKDIIIKLMDEAGKTRIMWTVINAFPIQVDAPDFMADSNDVAIETIVLRADSMQMEKA
ncbi:MAG: phage tail protein [Bacteroidota bacterium]